MPPNDRPLLAIVAKALSPYRLRLHMRIAREIPDVRLASLILQPQNNQPWSFDLPPEINLHWMAEPGIARPQGRSQRRYWQQAERVVHWLDEHRPAAVVITGYQDVGRIRIIRWCRIRNIPIYMFTDSNAAGDNPRGMYRLIKKPYVRWVVRNLSGLLVCGRGGVDYYRHYGGDALPHFFVPHEADYEMIEAISDEQIRAAQTQFHINPDRRLITYCGRLARVKRVDLLIDAFAAIAGERPEWDLLIIGDGPLRDELHARVPETIKDRIIWAGFVNDRTTINALYRASDVFVLPSEYEPWGTVVSEACAAGLAIVSSDVVGSALELVRDDVNGMTFPSGDAAALADALRNVTAADRIDAMQKASNEVLADWRKRGDPVDGIGAMLCHAGVLDSKRIKSNQPVEGVAV